MSDINYIEEKFKGIFSSLNTFKLQISSLQQQVKILEKNVIKDLNTANKIIEKKNKVKRKPSGFAIKGKISEELRDFMGLQEGELCARTEVTKYIISYIKEEGLQNEKDKRKIERDEALGKILIVPEGEELTYFTLQRYMNRHFLK